MLRRAALLTAAGLVLAGCTSSQIGTGEGRLTPGPKPSIGSSATAGAPATTPPAAGSSSSRSSGAPTSAAPKTGSSSTSAPPSQGNAPKGFKPMSVTFISPTDGWTLGYAGCTSARCTTILHSTDGTKTWRSIPVPPAAVDQPQHASVSDVSILRFATAQDGWAAGGALYATHDGGASWQRQQFNGTGGAVESLETGGGYVYLLASLGSKDQVYAAQLGSDRWQPVSEKLSEAQPHLVVSGADWYLAADGKVWHGAGFAQASKRGRSPCPVNKGYGHNPFLAISAPDSLDAVCSGDGALGSASYIVYGSNDGARTWRRNGAAQREFSGLWGLADNAHGVLLMAVASAASDILRSTDIGEKLQSTQPTKISGGYEWTDLGFTTETQAVAVLGGQAMYLSTDAGQSWRRVHFR